MDKIEVQSTKKYYDDLKNTYIHESDEEKRMKLGLTINNLADFLNNINKINNNKNSKYKNIEVPDFSKNNSVLEDDVRYSVLVYNLIRHLETKNGIEEFQGFVYDKVKMSDEEIFKILTDFYHYQDIPFSEDILNSKQIYTYKEKSQLLEKYLGLHYVAGVFPDYQKDTVYGICKKNKTINDIFNINYIASYGIKMMNHGVDFKDETKNTGTFITYMDFLLADYLKKLGFTDAENIKTTYYYNLIKNAQKLNKYMSSRYTTINQLINDLYYSKNYAYLYKVYDILYKSCAISLYEHEISTNKNINNLLTKTSFKIEDYSLDDKDIIETAKQIDIKKRIRK